MGRCTPINPEDASLIGMPPSQRAGMGWNEIMRKLGDAGLWGSK